MIGKKLLSQTPLSMPEVKNLIEKRKKEGELSYEQNLTFECCNQFSKLSQKETQDMVKELSALEKLGEKHAVMLSYIFPRNADEIKLMFSKEHFILGDEEISQIIEILNKFRKEKKG